MRALVTGATGFIGSQLLKRLDKPVVLSRNPEEAKRRLASSDVTVFGWDPAAGQPPAAALEGIDVVFHLAGESVGEGRWTAARKQRIRASRVEGTRLLVQSLAQASHRPATLISGSAIGYYGSRQDELLDETSSAGSDFLAEVCTAWESEAQAASALGMRVVCLRTGIVLGPGGGALAKMLTPFKMGVGGRLGSGWQWMSWIHLDDAVNLMLHATAKPDLVGPLNLVSPHPVINRDFTRVLARTLGRPAIFPAPAFALRLAIGEFADVLLGSQRVVPRAAERSGFEFRHPQLSDALEQILHATR
ncbi:MAG: TIGR01777 family oxidoreductase [Planctomycetia bacterium]|nr:TIGR01777 family oxidoreductase [Planctomycetia bacterium]